MTLTEFAKQKPYLVCVDSDGCAMDTMLADCPMLRTYINAYDSNDDTMDALVDALVTGDFRGKDPIDSFCGMWDTRI